MTTVSRRLTARSIAAQAAFRARVEAVGGEVLETEWLGALQPHRVRCAAGHPTSPRPANVQQGQGICRICAGLDPRVSEVVFRARVEAVGGEVLETEWLGALQPHRVRCAAGHLASPRPNDVQQGQGICRSCAGQEPGAAEAAFRARVDELGGEVLEPVWLGKSRPHRVRCASGHMAAPRPDNVQQGRGICRTCAGKAWDVFYVVTGPDADGQDVVKFGITSGDPRPRLAAHHRDGYDRTVRLLVDLPDGVAPAIERAALAALRLARLQPVRGREYFPGVALRLVLDIVDNYPIAAS